VSAAETGNPRDAANTWNNRRYTARYLHAAYLRLVAISPCEPFPASREMIAEALCPEDAQPMAAFSLEGALGHIRFFHTLILGCPLDEKVLEPFAKAKTRLKKAENRAKADGHAPVREALFWPTAVALFRRLTARGLQNTALVVALAAHFGFRSDHELLDLKWSDVWFTRIRGRQWVHMDIVFKTRSEASTVDVPCVCKPGQIFREYDHDMCVTCLMAKKHKGVKGERTGPIFYNVAQGATEDKKKKIRDTILKPIKAELPAVAPHLPPADVALHSFREGSFRTVGHIGASVRGSIAEHGQAGGYRGSKRGKARTASHYGGSMVVPTSEVMILRVTQPRQYAEQLEAQQEAKFVGRAARGKLIPDAPVRRTFGRTKLNPTHPAPRPAKRTRT